jgi:hypothetical protein
VSTRDTSRFAASPMLLAGSSVPRELIYTDRVGCHRLVVRVIRDSAAPSPRVARNAPYASVNRSRRRSPRKCHSSPGQAALGCIIGPERHAEAFRSPAEGAAAPSGCRSILREAVERRVRASRKPNVARVSMPIASRRLVTGLPDPTSTGNVASRCRSSGARTAHGGPVGGSASVRPIARSRSSRRQPARPHQAAAAGAAFATPLGRAAPARSVMPRQIARPARLAALAAANRVSASVERSRRGTQRRESLANCASPPRPSRRASRRRSPFILAAKVRARPSRALDQGRWTRPRWSAQGRTAARLIEAEHQIGVRNSVIAGRESTRSERGPRPCAPQAALLSRRI